MKNIHVLTTDKPSRVFITKDEGLGFDNQMLENTELDCQNQNIYITSDEEIKVGDWVYSEARNTLFKVKSICNTSAGYLLIQDDVIMPLEINEVDCKKIILTTDQDLIKDGVQEIDDEFLEWFFKNPSCETVKVITIKRQCDEKSCSDCQCTDDYKIIIPKEEPKQKIDTCYNFDKEIGCVQVDCRCEKKETKIYYNTVGRENGEFVIKGQFNTQKEALDLANELNRKFPDLYYDWNETLIKEELKQDETEHLLSTEINKKRLLDNAKQETLEEALDNYTNSPFTRAGFINGVNWQKERSYSEEEIINILVEFSVDIKKVWNITEWFEQFKTK